MEKEDLCKIVIGILLPLVLIAQTENWIYTYNGSGNYTDEARSIVYGMDGNIYAAGMSRAGDSIYFAVISLSTAGDTNWVYTYNVGPIPSHGTEGAYSIVYGLDGNIYAAGGTAGDSPALLVISLTTAGDTNWTYTYSGPGDSVDVAFSVVYGLDGNIYAAGMSVDSITSRDFLVISLTAAGDTNWTYTYNGSGNLWDEANAIVYGADGNIYAAGMTANIGTVWDFLVISLTTAGDTNWVYTYDGPGYGWDGANAIVYGSDGNIYATGYYDWVMYPNTTNLVVISLTAAGDTNWVYLYPDPENRQSNASSIVYGSDGNIYVAGTSSGSGTYNDFLVISLTSAGDTNWVYTYDGPGPGDGTEGAHSLVYGLDGNIYVAGNSISSSYDFLVISLTASGDTNWVYTYNGPGDDTDNARSIIYGSDGNIYAAGLSTGIGTGWDFTVISLSPGVGLHEEDVRESTNRSYGATIFSGSLHLPEGIICRVFDITGRVVAPDKIRPGVYFVEVDGNISQKIVKIK